MLRIVGAVTALSLALAFPAALRAEGGADAPFVVSAEKQEAREALVERMKTATLAVLQDQSKSYDARAENLQNGFIKMVDVDWIAQFALGNAWKAATSEQRASYTDLYRQFLLKTYVEAFGQSNDRKITDIRLLGIVHKDNDKFTARTELELSTSERLKVDYLVAEKPGSHKIIDIVIEHVSLLATHRAEFGKIAAVKGVDGVIATLQASVNPVKLAMNQR